MDQIRKLISSLTLRQQISIGVVLIAVGVGLWLFTKWNRERDFRPLYTNLAAEDAGAVMAKLKEENVEFRVDDSGTALRVASEKVAELRQRRGPAVSGCSHRDRHPRQSFGPPAEGVRRTRLRSAGSRPGIPPEDGAGPGA